MSTMFLALAARERRALVAGSAAIAAIVLAGRGVPTWLHLRREARLEAESRTALLARAKDALRQERDAAESLAVREGRFRRLGSVWLSGESSASAGAALAGIVTDAASRAGLRLGAVQVRDDSTSLGPYSVVGASAQVTGDVSGLAAFLTAVEAGPTVLAVRQLSVRQDDPAGAANKAEVLRVDILVEGLVRNGAFATARGGMPSVWRK